MPEISIITIMLIPVAAIAGFISSVAGGGGVLFVPTAIALGLPPVNALALNRITDIGVLIGSANNFRKVQNVPWEYLYSFVPLFLAGAIAGAFFSVSIPEDYLKWIIIGATLFAITVIILKPSPQVAYKAKGLILGYLSVVLVGFWDGAVAMGGATLFIIAVHFFFGMNYLKARAINLFAGMPEVCVSASILYYHSTVPLNSVIILFLAATAGAALGSKMALTKGSEFVRYGMVLVSILMVSKLIIVDMFLG